MAAQDLYKTHRKVLTLLDSLGGEGTIYQLAIASGNQLSTSGLGRILERLKERALVEPIERKGDVCLWRRVLEPAGAAAA